MLSSFTFLSPLYLIGLAAALIPLIIHLSRSRRTKKMRFSTTRFFTEQFLRSYRMSRVKEVFLLVCRMALFALLAMALARPFVPPRGGAGLAGSGPRTVVLVLDNSASMGYVEEGKPLFERAQAAAHTVLGSLSPGDTISVVLAGRRDEGPEVLFPDPTDQRDEGQRAVKQLRATALGTDLSGAVGRAEELASVGRAAGRSAAIYVISDLQEGGWSEPDSSPALDRSEVSYFVVGVRPRQKVTNRAVTAVRYSATRPRVGVPFTIRAVLALPEEDRKGAAVRLHVDGAKVGERTVEGRKGSRWAGARFDYTFAKAGWHSGHVEIDDDALAADNRRYFAVEMPDKTEAIDVLAVNGAPSAVAHQDELFFLRLALTAAPEGQNSPFRLTAVAPAEMADKLDKYPLVILANVEKLAEPAVEKLEDYVEKGGSLLVFLGDKVDASFYNAVLGGANRRHGGLLPARLRTPAKEEDVGFISAVNYEHRALSIFQGPRLGTLLGPSLRFKALRVEAPAGRVLMKSSNGAPLLCEKEFGKGNVMLFASTCDRDWSDFPIRPAFPIWSRYVAEYLTQAPLVRDSSHFTGDTVRFRPRGEEEKGTVWIRKPDDKLVTAERDGGGSFLCADTALPGIYTVLKSDQKTTVGLFAVNVEGHESDLTYLDEGAGKEGVEKELKERLGGPPIVTYVEDAGQLGNALGGGRRGFRLWDVVLVVVLLIGLFEPWLANQISARLYGKPRDVPVIALPGAQGLPAARAPVVEKVEGAAR